MTTIECTNKTINAADAATYLFSLEDSGSVIVPQTRVNNPPPAYANVVLPYPARVGTMFSFLLTGDSFGDDGSYLRFWGGKTGEADNWIRVNQIPDADGGYRASLSGPPTMAVITCVGVSGEFNDWWITNATQVSP